VTPLYPQKLALTSPTGGGRSVSIVRSRTKATEFRLLLLTATGLYPVAVVISHVNKNMKLVTDKFRFKSGGLHEKHVVATWNLGSHISIRFYRHRGTEKNLCRGGRSQDLPNIDF